MSNERVAVTSVVRSASRTQSSGCLRVIDLDRRNVVSCSPLPESAHRADDPNPRGGVRGARGLAVLGDRLFVANSERLFVLDRSWRLRGSIGHPWLGGIHEVMADADGVWVTCTSADLLAKVSGDGDLVDHWTWRADRRLARALGFPLAPRFDEELDYRDPSVVRRVTNIVHVNALAQQGDGLLVSFGRVVSPRRVGVQLVKRRVAGLTSPFGLPRQVAAQADIPFPAGRVEGSRFALVHVRSPGARPLREAGRGRIVLIRDDVAVPNHNVLSAGGRVLYNDSNSGELVVHDLTTGAEERRIGIPGSPSFARGLAQLDERRFLVGSQAPAAVHVVDIQAGRVVSTIDLGGQRREAVFGIVRLPDGLADPPRRLTWS